MASKWLPFKKVNLRTKLSMDVMRCQFVQMVEPEQFMRMNFFGLGFKKPYEGYLSNNSFSMRRLIWYRNSFQPRIIGVFEQEKYDILIRLNMRLQIFVMVFLLIFLFFALIFTLSVVITAVMQQRFHPSMLIGFLIFIFVYLAMILSFRYETRRTIRDFEKFFNAKIIEDAFLEK